MRPSPVRPRVRKVSAQKPPPIMRKPRKAVSEPPQQQSPISSGVVNFESGVPKSNFEPDLPPTVRVTRAMRTSFIHQDQAARMQIPEVVEQVKEEVEETDLPEEEEEQQGEQEVIDVSSDSPDGYQEQRDLVDAVSSRIAEGGAVVRVTPQQKQSSHWFLRLVMTLLLLTMSGVTYDFKQQSAPIGFCDTGKDTNMVLESSRSQLAAVEACNRENRTLLYSTDSKVDSDDAPCPPLYPIPHPDSCTPCPKHASCTQRTVTCDSGYLIRPHPILSLLPRPSTATSMTWAFPEKWDADFSVDYVWQALALAGDGLPGVGPIAFAPRCLEDPKRKRHIGVLGKAVESLLGQERGRRVCAGVRPSKPEKDMTEADEAQFWGVDVDTLRDAMKRKTSVRPLRLFIYLMLSFATSLTFWKASMIRLTKQFSNSCNGVVSSWARILSECYPAH